MGVHVGPLKGRVKRVSVALCDDGDDVLRCKKIIVKYLFLKKHLNQISWDYFTRVLSFLSPFFLSGSTLALILRTRQRLSRCIECAHVCTALMKARGQLWVLLFGNAS